MLYKSTHVIVFAYRALTPRWLQDFVCPAALTMFYKLTNVIVFACRALTPRWLQDFLLPAALTKTSNASSLVGATSTFENQATMNPLCPRRLTYHQLEAVSVQPPHLPMHFMTEALGITTSSSSHAFHDGSSWDNNLLIFPPIV